MKKMKLFDKKIPTRNYFIVLVVSILVIIACLYLRTFYLTYRNNKLSTSVFSNQKIKQINTKDINFALTETGDVLLYVSYTGNNDIYNSEKKMYEILEKKELLDDIIYWNVSDYGDSTDYIATLKKQFPNIKDEITNAPLLIYIKDGEAVEAMSSELKTIDYKVLNKMIEKYVSIPETLTNLLSSPYNCLISELL